MNEFTKGKINAFLEVIEKIDSIKQSLRNNKSSVLTENLLNCYFLFIDELSKEIVKEVVALVDEKEKNNT